MSDETQDWYFTFGWGQTHPANGESLNNRYVRIHGTFEDARQQMIRAFGKQWCDQYVDAERAGVAEYGLKEIALPAEEPAEEQPFSPLVGAIFTQMITDSQFTTNALIDNYKAQLSDARAELYAIRQGIAALLGHPWTPSSEAVSQAVFAPSSVLREEYLERYAEEDR